MKLTEQQRAWLEEKAKTGDGAILRSILDGYILELKDDVLEETITPAVGKAAIGKLKELANKTAVLAGDSKERDPRMFT